MKHSIYCLLIALLTLATITSCAQSSSSSSATQTLTGHSSDVRSVAFSPDGSKLASGSDDNSIKIWNMSSTSVLRAMD